MPFPPYVRLETDGDHLAVRVFGATLTDVFEESAYAMFDVGYELEGVAPTYARPIVAAGDTPAELLVAWLSEVLAMSRIEGIVPSFFVVDRLEEGGVQGSASGRFTPEVVSRGRIVGEVLTSTPQFVEIPDGFWVELRFSMINPLRPM